MSDMPFPKIPTGLLWFDPFSQKVGVKPPKTVFFICEVTVPDMAKITMIRRALFLVTWPLPEKVSQTPANYTVQAKETVMVSTYVIYTVVQLSLLGLSLCVSLATTGPAFYSRTARGLQG
jgi:hypothetical protein